MTYIVEGEIVDTYGGDYTYRDVWYEIENNEYIFYECCYGAKPSETERITEESDIKTYISMIKNNI